MGNGRRMWRTATVALMLPTAAAAQATARSGGPACEGGAEPVGSLGITGISCDRCQFFTNGKVHRAVFWTEPTILDLDPSNPAASVLHEGDVLVAVDGQLITTRGGSARFSALPPDEPTRLRIRRDGRTMELSVPVASVCPATRSADAPVVAGRPVPVPPLAPSPRTAPVPRVPGATPPMMGVTPTPEVPGVPDVPSVAALPSGLEPRADLGFGFQCDYCEYDRATGIGNGRWTFPQPPIVMGVDEDAGDVALRPGDRLLELGGLDLTTAEGGRRFANIRPGQTLRWTVLRDGKRIEVTTHARERDRTAALAAAEPTTAGARTPAPLRFAGTVGNTTVEVRGGRVNVTEDEGGRLLIIRTADSEIRIRVPAGEGRR